MQSDVQGNGGADVDMTQVEPVVYPEPVDAIDVPVSRAVKPQERIEVQEKPTSVWDRINLHDRNRQTEVEVDHMENRGKWKKNAAATLRAGLGKGRGARELKFRGRKVGPNGHLLGDALRRVNLEQMQNRNGLHPRNQVDFAHVNGEAEDDDQPIKEVDFSPPFLFIHSPPYFMPILIKLF